MPVTEIVRPNLKPENAAAIRLAVRAYFDTFADTPGLLSYQVGHVIRVNGKDISDQNRAVLGIEWDKSSSFQDFISSDKINSFRDSMLQYVTELAIPQLFTPATGHARSDRVFGASVTQIFVGKDDGSIDGAWNRLVKNIGTTSTWSGKGIENAEGNFAGMIGWKNIEEYEEALAKEDVSKALEALHNVEESEDLVVRFGA